MVNGLGSNVFSYSYLTGSDLVQGYTTDSGFSAMHTFEPNRNLIASITNGFGGAQLRRFDYTNDEIGRRTQRADFDLSCSISNFFAYNIRSELEDAAMGTNSFNYRYDPIGNRRTATNNAEALAYAANSLNQYTNITDPSATSNPSYDLDGNMTSYRDWIFIWDAENRLVLASNATTVVSNSYDYMSRRVSKTVSSPTSSFIPHTSSFLYQGWAMIAESTATTTNSYVYGLDLSGSQQGAGTIGGILAGNFSGTTAFYTYDANGNVTDLVGTNGEFLAQYQFDPYGNTISKTGALADVNPFRFSTKYTDSETGMLYYGYRYYHLESGRWASRDPLGEQGSSLYVFLGNAPINRIDPKGLWGADVHYGWTRAWAVDVGYQTAAASDVADADNAVDDYSGGIGPLPWILGGDQSYHFNRSSGSEIDSRILHFTSHFAEAKKWCDWKSYGDIIGDVSGQAALNLGTGLHPRQDWVAHGDYGIHDVVVGLHNAGSLQWTYGNPFTYPDRFDLDATGGADGRPAGSAMMDDFTIANYAPGPKRRNLTESLTREALRGFLDHVRERSKPCGDCRRFFLGAD